MSGFQEAGLVAQFAIYGTRKKSTFYAGIRIFNSLPLSLISLKNEKTKFNVALRKYLNTHCFYSVDESFMYKDGS
jgi:hypothetical protein